MRLAVRLSAFALVLAAQSAFAADGSNGCGPGWYVFKENSMVSSALRWVTNYLFFPVSTLGMTFGTSNCSQHKLVEKDQDSLQFAAKNFEILRHDIARGQGDHLNAYLSSFSCQPLVQQNLAADLQRAYRDGLNASSDPALFVSSTRFLIERSQTNQMMCS